jgi:predicted SprT family Zn-dependent metalloprotease
MAITKKEYTAFQKAYDYFNQELFSGKLPPCLITLTHSKKYEGFFHRERFTHRRDDRKTDELSLNIDHFHHMADREILAILVHEMVHLWQFHYGKPSRNGYHNKEWSNRMTALGLMPSDIAQPGGNRTGQSMNHYIIEGGRYARLTEKLINQGFKINWQIFKAEREKKTKSKIKYSCPVCHQNAWAKPGAELLCGVCMEMMKSEEHDRQIRGQTERGD